MDLKPPPPLELPSVAAPAATPPRKPNRHERRALAAIARSPEKSAKFRAAQEAQRLATPAPAAEETPPTDT
jgi:hypothetical protein